MPLDRPKRRDIVQWRINRIVMRFMGFRSRDDFGHLHDLILRCELLQPGGNVLVDASSIDITANTLAANSLKGFVGISLGSLVILNPP